MESKGHRVLFFRVSSLLSLFCNSIFSLRRCSNIRTWLLGAVFFVVPVGPSVFFVAPSVGMGQQKTYEKHKYTIGLSHRNL